METKDVKRAKEDLIKLQSSLKAGRKLKLEELSPLAIDTIRGWTWEQKSRLPFDEFLDSNCLAFSNDLLSLLNRLSILESPWNIPESRFIKLSPLSIGLGTFAWKYDHAIIKQAIESGIDLIDTAETYGYGRTEKELGKALQGCSLEHPLLATKVCRTHLSYNSVLKAALRSRQKLNLLFGDLFLYQIHWLNPKFPISETMRAMRQLIKEHHIDLVGVCNHSILQLYEAQVVLGNIPIFSLQVRYNLLDRGIEWMLLPFCLSKNIRVIAYSPFGQDFRKIKQAFGYPVLQKLSKRHQVTSAQIALAWMCSKKVIPIPRTNNLNHVREIADSIKIHLNKEEIEEIDHGFPITI